MYSFKAFHPLTLMLALLTCLLTASAQDAPDNKGTEFWLGFASNNGTPDLLQLFLTSDVSTTATVSVESQSFSETVDVNPNVVTTVNIPFGAIANDSGSVVNSGIHVIADDEVSAYAINARNATTDAYLGLPVDVMGTEYLILAHDSPHGGSFIQIVGTADATTVTVTPTVATEDGKTAGVPFDVSLNEGDTVAYYSFNYADLSGSIVTSDKPVAVFAGNECGEVPSGVDACDHMVEQINPTSTWGNRFVTMPLATRTRSIFYRFLAAEDDTTVTIETTAQEVTVADAFSLDRGDFAVRDFLESAIINSDKPILLMQYSPSSNWDGVTSDPFMVVVPPFEQFGGSTTVINVPTGNIPIHFINVVAPTSSVGAVFLDGSPITSTLFHPIGNSGFSGAQVSVSGGSHTLASNVAFGVTAYGYGNFDSYGYPGGLLLGDVAEVDNMEIISLDDSAPIFSEFCAVAKVTDSNGDPLVGIRVDFTVSGANQASGFGTTDASGEALLCYTGVNPGTDTLTATARLGALQDTTTIEWFGLEYELYPEWNLIFLGVDLPGGDLENISSTYGNTPATFFGEGFFVYRLKKTISEESGRVTYEYIHVAADEPLIGGTAYWVYNPLGEKVTIEVLEGTIAEARELNLTHRWNMTGTTLGLTGLTDDRPVLSVLIWDGIRQRYVPAPKLEGQFFWDFVTGVFIYVTEDIVFTPDREVPE